MAKKSKIKILLLQAHEFTGLLHQIHPVAKKKKKKT